VVVRHPLWTDDHPRVDVSTALLKERHPTAVVKVLSPFMLLRRPTEVL
jgi:hypothetical protein